MEIIQKTIGEMLAATVERWPEQEALVHTTLGIRYPYALFGWEIERAAKGLIELGITKGDRVALWAPNIPEWPIAQMAAAKAGAVIVPVDPEADKENVSYLLNQSGARALIMARGLEDAENVNLSEEIRDCVPLLEHIIVAATQSFPGTVPWTELTAMGESVPPQALVERERTIGPEDPVAIMYTSGTTGIPKGVVLDHRGLINKSLASTRRQGLTPQDRLCLFFPAFHMFGNTCIALSGFLVGSAVIMPCLAFHVQQILEAIYREKCTALYGSPSMITALLDAPQFKKKRWATVKKGILGGAPCPLDLMKRLVKDVGVTDITVGYGITETCSWITMTRPEDSLERRSTTIGMPLDCNEVKIVHLSTGETVPPNTQGELCVRGLLMKGYHDMPAATAGAVDMEGWFHTGDLGEMDETGYVRITGRLKDVILRDGIEIHPSELEEVIYTLPEISDVQVFGFPYPGRGQEVAAWVKLRDGMHPSLEAFSETIRQMMSPEKAPHYIKFVTSFPMTRTGKVQKFRLSEMAQREYL